MTEPLLDVRLEIESGRDSVELAERGSQEFGREFGLVGHRVTLDRWLWALETPTELVAD